MHAEVGNDCQEIKWLMMQVVVNDKCNEDCQVHTEREHFAVQVGLNRSCALCNDGLVVDKGMRIEREFDRLDAVKNLAGYLKQQDERDIEQNVGEIDVVFVLAVDLIPPIEDSLLRLLGTTKIKITCKNECVISDHTHNRPFAGTITLKTQGTQIFSYQSSFAS